MATGRPTNNSEAKNSQGVTILYFIFNNYSTLIHRVLSNGNNSYEWMLKYIFAKREIESIRNDSEQNQVFE